MIRRWQVRALFVMERFGRSLRAAFFSLTGGRPMRRLRCEFVDVVSGQEVNRYRDGLGRTWLANGRWSIFRVGV